MLKRYSNGLQFNMNYAWQKALDGQSSLAEVKVQNPFDRRQDYSRSSWDINHVFNFAYVYELPFGKGRKFGANWASAADLLLGGWALEGITRLETGTATVDFDRVSIVPTQAVRLNVPIWQVIPTRVQRHRMSGSTRRRLFCLRSSRLATQAPTSPTRTASSAIDFAVEKKFPIRERHAIEFRTEFFNMPNTVNFADPTTAMNNANFGRITSQRTPPRQIQFGLRYRF